MYRYINNEQTSLGQWIFSFKGTHPCGRTIQIVPWISLRLWLPPIILMASWIKQFFTAHTWRLFMIMPIIGRTLQQFQHLQMKISWYLLFLSLLVMQALHSGNNHTISLKRPMVCIDSHLTSRVALLLLQVGFDQGWKCVPKKVKI